MRVFEIGFYRNVLKRLITSFRWRLLCPKAPEVCLTSLTLLTFGSQYGRKTLVQPKENLRKVVLISGGIGEDISFDIEFANKFNSLIILVDPSESAQRHMQETYQALGQKCSKEYSVSSRQLVSSYNLEQVQKEDFIYLQKALWHSSGEIGFYLPEDISRDSSGSINGIHNFYRKGKPDYIVQGITIDEIVKTHKLNKIDILKLDIEGSGLEVLSQMFSDGIFPNQLLVEFDELHFPSFRSKFRGEKLFRLLRKNNYIPVSRDSCDFTYVRKDAF